MKVLVKEFQEATDNQIYRVSYASRGRNDKADITIYDSKNKEIKKFINVYPHDSLWNYFNPSEIERSKISKGSYYRGNPLTAGERLMKYDEIVDLFKGKVFPKDSESYFKLNFIDHPDTKQLIDTIKKMNKEGKDISEISKAVGLYYLYVKDFIK